ncbi:MAG: S41 family peptidase, partial [Alphaproteobacteria bacterium]
GRTAERELRQAVSAVGAGAIVLDLRANRGGDFERMLRVAGLLTGPTKHALSVIGKDGRRLRAIPATGPIAGVHSLTVVVGGETASSAEMLAALLRRHAGAEVVGERTRGKDTLVRVIPVHHDWRLVLPAERVEIAGEDLAGGLRPDRAAPDLAPR